MVRAGVPEEEIQALIDEARTVEEPPLHVSIEEHEAISLFARIQTQWNRGFMGEYLSLNYPAVESVARMVGIEMSSDLLRSIQIMERAVIQEKARRD